MSKCAYINKILSMAWVANCQNSEYGKVLIMAVFSASEYYTAF